MYSLLFYAGAELRGDGMESLAAISAEPSDMLGLFYLCEYYCRWGSGSARRPYVRNRFSLFHSPALAGLAYRLPAPVSQNLLLHRTAIRRYMPKAYHWLINRTEYLPLYDYPRLSKAFAEVMIRITDNSDRLRRRLSRQTYTATYHDAVGDAFASQLADVLRDTLLGDNSIAVDLLGRANMQVMLDQHISGAVNHLQTIGFLVTLQQYRAFITEASILARQDV